MAKYWFHCNHLHVKGKKMSKSRGNVIYTDTLLRQGYSRDDIRFFLIHGHYREKQIHSDNLMNATTDRLRRFKKLVKSIQRRALQGHASTGKISRLLQMTFTEHMDNDLRVREAFDGLSSVLSGIEVDSLPPAEAAGIIKTLRKIDEVLQVIF
jgi:cysteinyl-tRNA synthetase